MVVADASQIYRSIAEDAERPQFSGLASTLTSAKTSIVIIAQIHRQWHRKGCKASGEA
jgi:hypothetical protein